MSGTLYTIYWQLRKSLRTMHFNMLFFVIGKIIWPIIMVGTLYLSYTPLLDSSNQLITLLTSEGSLWSFLLPGIIVISFNLEYISIGTHLSFHRDFGILEPIYLSPVNRTLWLLGSCTSIIPSSIISIFSFLATSILLFQIDIPNLLPLIGSILFVLILSLSWGALISSIFLIGRNSRILYAIFESPAEFLSGTRFPVKVLPGAVSTIATIYPLSHSVKIVRYFWVDRIMWGNVKTESLQLILLSIIYLIFAVLIFRFAEEKGKREGSLTFS